MQPRKNRGELICDRIKRVIKLQQAHILPIQCKMCRVFSPFFGFWPIDFWTLVCINCVVCRGKQFIIYAKCQISWFYGCWFFFMCVCVPVYNYSVRFCQDVEQKRKRHTPIIANPQKNKPIWTIRKSIKKMQWKCAFEEYFRSYQKRPLQAATKQQRHDNSTWWIWISLNSKVLQRLRFCHDLRILQSTLRMLSHLR